MSTLSALRNAGVLHPSTLGVIRDAGMLNLVMPRPSLLGLAVRMPFRTPNLGSAVHLHAATRPHDAAVIDRTGELTWRQLEERTNRLANWILERMKGTEDAASGGRVAFMLRNGREMVECYAACGLAGATAVPVNTWSTAAEVAHVIETQDPALIVADREFADSVEGGAPDTPRLWVGQEEASGGEDYESALDGASPRVPKARGAAKIVTHTSGTTGKPKGAERDVGADSLAPFVRFLEKVPLHRRDRFLIAPPMFHSFAQGMAAVTLVIGGTLVLPHRFDPADTIDLARRTGATAAALVPVMLRRMLDVEDRSAADTLRLIVLSGSALPGPLRERAEEVYGRIFYDLYGSTEVGWATIATPDDQVRKPGTVGAPGKGMSVFAAGDDGSVLPPGEIGRIYVATGFEFEGYTGVDSDREMLGDAMEFGDEGWVDEDGYVFISGRADDMIVSGGENVYPSEAEEALEAHAEVADVAVLGVEDEEYGEVLHAYVVRANGSSLDEEGVISHVRERLARYKAPKHVTFLDELPRNATGKVLKRELPS
jgi:fatty-acyl-CoA synthase